MTVVQRWRLRRDTYRCAGEPIRTADYEVSEIPDDTTARRFVEAHHYSASYPAARRRYGLHRRGELVGAAVLSVAPSQAAITAALPLPVEPDQRAELGRFVLLDDVPANGESWFLARCWELAREADIVAIVAHSDPVARLRADGTRVFPGHIGTIYQATNARYVGLTPRRSQRLFGDGTVLSARAISKLRVRERGWRYALESLVAHGAPEPSGDWRDWCRIAIESTTRVVRHSGNHRYVWALDRALRRHLPERRAYPKAETWRTAA